MWLINFDLHWAAGTAFFNFQFLTRMSLSQDSMQFLSLSLSFLPRLCVLLLKLPLRLLSSSSLCPSAALSPPVSCGGRGMRWPRKKPSSSESEEEEQVEQESSCRERVECRVRLLSRTLLDRLRSPTLHSRVSRRGLSLREPRERLSLFSVGWWPPLPRRELQWYDPSEGNMIKWDHHWCKSKQHFAGT